MRETRKSWGDAVLLWDKQGITLFNGYVIVFMAPGREPQESLPNPTQLAAGVYRDLLDPSSPWWLDREFPGRKMVCGGPVPAGLGDLIPTSRAGSSLVGFWPEPCTHDSTGNPGVVERHRWLVLLAHARSVRPGCPPGYCSIVQTAGSNDRRNYPPKRRSSQIWLFVVINKGGCFNLKTLRVISK